MQTTIAHDIAQAAYLRDNELESAKTTARKLWGAVWGLSVLLGIAVVANAVQGTQHRWVIRYVEVDKASQQARVIEPAAERYEPSQAIAKATLERYIKTLRSVSTDPQDMEDNWQSLKVCLTKNGKQRLREYEATQDPRKQKAPRAVQVLSSLRKTARTYDFRWQEWQYKEDKSVDYTTTYSASLIFERRDPQNEKELAHCPTGIFLDSFVLGKDV